MAFLTEDVSINTLIGIGSSIKGDVKVNGFVRVDGDIDGDLTTDGNVIVGEKARIRGNITARSVIVGGIVQGNIVAPVMLHLLTASTVLGDVCTHRFIVDEEVIMHGHCIALADEGAYSNAIEQFENRSMIGKKMVHSAAVDVR